MIKSSTSKTFLQAPKLYGLYCLDNELPKNFAYPCLTAKDIHKRLGHISFKALKCLLKHGMIEGIQLDFIGDKIICDAWIKFKMQTVLKESGECSRKLGGKASSDVWGLSRHLTIEKSHIISLLQMTT